MSTDVHFETEDGLKRVTHANGRVCCVGQGCGDCANCTRECEECHPVPACCLCHLKITEGPRPYWQCATCRGEWWCDECFPEAAAEHDSGHAFIEN